MCDAQPSSLVAKAGRAGMSHIARTMYDIQPSTIHATIVSAAAVT